MSCWGRCLPPPLKKKKKKAFEQGIGKTSLWWLWSHASAVPTPQTPPAVFNRNCFNSENTQLFCSNHQGRFLFSQGACGAFVILASLQLSLQQQNQCPTGQAGCQCCAPFPCMGEVLPHGPWLSVCPGCMVHLFSTVQLALGSISDQQPWAFGSLFVKS